jgi:heme/copper-type cytochrome/quinol oxidase subunit 2
MVGSISLIPKGIGGDISLLPSEPAQTEEQVMLEILFWIGVVIAVVILVEALASSSGYPNRGE